MLIGVALFITNKEIAVMTGTSPHGFNEFWSSIARQYIAATGVLVAIAGVTSFLFL